MNKLYTYTLDNGLKVYLYPDMRRHSTFFQLSTFCGGMTKHFSVDGKKYSFQDGIAHILEHYIVECNNRGNFLEELGKKQMATNASTSISVTSYYFEAVENVNFGINTLLEGVYSVYFDSEKLEKLKNPICQEIRGKMDSKFYHLNRKKIENLFVNIDYRDVGGLLDEVNQTTIDDLKVFYEAFYQPSNQFIVMAGNFDKKDVLSVIKDFFKKHFIPKKEVQMIDWREPLTISKKEDTVIFPTPMEYFDISFKIDISSYTKEKLMDFDFYIQAFLNHSFGIQSVLYQSLIDDKIIIEPIHFSSTIMNHFLIVTVGDYTNNSSQLKDKILKEFQEQEHMNPDLFLLDKQNSIIRFILRDESIFKMINPFITNLIDYQYPYLDTLEDIERLNFDDFVDCIHKVDFSNYVCMHIKNNE